MKKTVKHPCRGLSISFDPASHTYADSDGRRYTSGTGLVRQYFYPFNAPDAAERIASRDGTNAPDVLAEWESKAATSSAFGTRIHEYAESLIIGTTPPPPESDNERRARRIVDKALVGIERHYEILGAEQIVFDPLYLIAGTIDLPARNRETGALAILDWKTCESITLDSYGRQALTPIAHVPDSKVHHYALQLSAYAWILAEPSRTYPSAGEPVELAMIHIPHIGEDPIWRPVDYMRDEVDAMIMDNYSRIRAERAERIAERNRNTKG